MSRDYELRNVSYDIACTLLGKDIGASVRYDDKTVSINLDSRVDNLSESIEPILVYFSHQKPLCQQLCLSGESTVVVRFKDEDIQEDDVAYHRHDWRQMAFDFYYRF